MNNIEPGTLIECINDKLCGFTKNKTYEISRIGGGIYFIEDMILYVIQNDMGDICMIPEREFDKFFKIVNKLKDGK